jgi:hypothetical protein
MMENKGTLRSVCSHAIMTHVQSRFAPLPDAAFPAEGIDLFHPTELVDNFVQNRLLICPQGASMRDCDKTMTKKADKK